MRVSSFFIFSEEIIQCCLETDATLGSEELSDLADTCNHLDLTPMAPPRIVFRSAQDSRYSKKGTVQV